MAFRFAGALEEDSPALAAVWQRGCRGVVQDGSELVAYFDEPVDLPVEGRWEAVETIDWLEAYFAGLEPVDAGAVVVAPTHRRLELRAGQVPVWLDPGMAFGTGHHESTRLILRALGRRDLVGLRVLDVGTGSGILAIAADRLGAAAALGVDDDPATIPVARANGSLNRSRARFELGTLDPDGRVGDEGPRVWDVVVANLFAELHVRLLPAYAAAAARGAAILLSGIQAERVEGVLDAVRAPLGVAAHETDGAWHLLELVRA